jgi:hypothetical protein
VHRRTLATLPWKLLSSTDPAKRRELPLTHCWTSPTSEISRIDWLKQYATSMALRGNFIGARSSSATSDLYPSQIKPIHPDRARVRRLPSGQVEYRSTARSSRSMTSSTSATSLAGSLEGLNPIECLRLAIGKAIDAGPSTAPPTSQQRQP